MKIKPTLIVEKTDMGGHVREKKLLKVSNAKQQEHCILEIRLEHIDPVPQNRKPQVLLTILNLSPQLIVRCRQVRYKS